MNPFGHLKLDSRVAEHSEREDWHEKLGHFNFPGEQVNGIEQARIFDTHVPSGQRYWFELEQDFLLLH